MRAVGQGRRLVLRPHPRCGGDAAGNQAASATTAASPCSAAGAAERICADGISAGGYLALLLATWRPDVYCVVSRAGASDLASTPGQPAYDTATGTLGQFNGGRWLFNIGSAAFGQENVRPQSPVANAAGPLKATRVLQGFSADDQLVPWGQATELRDAMLAAAPGAYSDVLQLPKGTVRFGHGYVTQASLDDFHAREVQLVAPIGGLFATCRRSGAFRTGPSSARVFGSARRRASRCRR